MECDASTECPFCHPERARVIARHSHFFVFEDGFPVSPGHTLVIPNRHVATIAELSTDEQAALFPAVLDAQRRLDESHRPDGYNIGINQGAAGGQTVPHLHVHVIPRYHGDQPDPRGGVRWIFPDKADYWS
ncbi:HIT family protein [Halomonas heilongjiangensis]|uniref:HIT family protein n=1 Tax=Halomonas heilongjiangensis TaxID=1387883 RepID=A0A2N7TQE7_9GAMM|nr:HIT family protein [Halomonas heilongjiangensis]PMR70413.1 HIT family protein [Halomonas heilongjiangensis]PXX91373.1 HIT family protein [Halomonas heilongjiangensis]